MFPDAKSLEPSVRKTGLLCRRLEKEYEKVEKPKMHLLRARKIHRKVHKDYCPLGSTGIFKLIPDSELQFSQVTADPQNPYVAPT